jgi:hypothetical protein
MTKKKAKVLKKKVRVPKPTQSRHIVEVRVKTEAAPAQPSTALVPLTPKDFEPIKEGGKYMIPKGWVNERQALFMMQKTPPQYVKQRQGKAGQQWSYVEGSYMVKVLNFAFAWNWDFKIVHQPTTAEILQIIGSKIDQIWVTGSLTVKDDAGHSITKEQTGGADIKFMKGTRVPVDIGNDMKAAMTDALKKCASEFGIASDIYGKSQAKADGFNVQDNNGPKTPPAAPREPQQPSAPAKPAIDFSYECHEGAEPITQQEAEYSKRVYGRPLCREHQKGAKRI